MRTQMKLYGIFRYIHHISSDLLITYSLEPPIYILMHNDNTSTGL